MKNITCLVDTNFKGWGDEEILPSIMEGAEITSNDVLVLALSQVQSSGME